MEPKNDERAAMDLGISLALLAAVGVILGVTVPPTERMHLAAALRALPTGTPVLISANIIPYALFPDGSGLGMAGIYVPMICCLGLLFSLPAMAVCICTQRLLLWTRSGSMKIAKAIGIILGSTAIFGGGGCLLGYFLGTYQPGYYRSVFSNGNSPTFDPVAVGIGLGLTQGLMVGLIVGCVVVLAIAIRTSPRYSPPNLGVDAGGHFETQEVQDSEPTQPGSSHIQADDSRLQSPERGV